MEHFRSDFEGSTVTLAYQDSGGCGEPVLYLHGLGSDSNDFLLLEDRESRSRYRLIAPDLPGHGETEWASDRAVTVDAVVELMARLVFHLGLSSLHLIGHSLGGAVAVRLAERDPKSICSLINVEGNLVPEDCNVLSRVGSEADNRRDPDRYFAWLTEELGKIPLSGYRAFANSYRNRISAVNEWFDYCQSLVELSDSGELLQAFLGLECRRVYVYGSESRPGFVDRLRSSGVVLCEMQGCSHWPMISSPAGFVRTLRRLLDEAPDAGSAASSSTSAGDVKISSMSRRAVESDPSAPVLIVPGYTNSGPGHWQSLWERSHPHFRRVEQRDWDAPVRDEWVDALHSAILEYERPICLVAHSLGCLTVAHWAERFDQPIAGALLVAPADPERADAPEPIRDFAPVPSQPFSFPSIVVASSNDPYLSVERAEELATRWGSRFVDVGAAGHLNTDSGFGPWPDGLVLLEELLSGTRRP